MGRDFLLATASIPALGPIQHPIQCVPGATSPGVKWPGRDAEQSPQSSAEVKNVWDYFSTSLYDFTGQPYFQLYCNFEIVGWEKKDDICTIIGWLQFFMIK
jgi:hypothetical protein